MAAIGHVWVLTCEGQQVFDRQMDALLSIIFAAVTCWSRSTVSGGARAS